MFRTSMSSIITATDLSNALPNVDVDGAVASQIVSAVNQWIENQTGRTWGAESTVTERHALAGTIWLGSTNVKGITSVTFGLPGRTQTTQSASSYYLSPGGRLTLSNFASGAVRGSRDYVQVVYTTDGAVPEDLKLAAIQTAMNAYTYAADGGREVSATSIGSYSVSYGGKSGQQTSGDIQTSAKAVIQSYRTVRF